MEQEAKGITTRLIIEYVRKAGGEGAVHELIAQAGDGFDEDYLCDERRWVSFDQKVRMFEAAKRILGDSEAPFRIGQSVVAQEAGAALKSELRKLKSPAAVLRAIPDACRTFGEVTSIELVRSGAHEGTLRYYVNPPATPHASDCEYNRGLLSTIPMLFGRGPAEVEHPVCAVRGEAPYCEYRVCWHSGLRSDWMLALLGAAAGLLIYTISGYPGQPHMDLGLLIQPVIGSASGFALGHLLEDRRRRAQSAESMRKQNTLLAKVNDQLVSDLETAYQVQRTLLPRENPKMKGLDVAGRLFYARRVGGDFYDYIGKGERLGVCIADVCGKGVQAALFTSVLKNALWQGMYTSNRPKKLLAYVEQQVNRQLPEEMFITMACAVVDVERERMVWSSAGHEPPILYRAARKQAEILDTKGLALGLRPLSLSSEDLCEEMETEFAPGDILMLYTDGALGRSAETEEARRYLGRLLEERSHLPAEAIVNEVFSILMSHSASGKRDDLTLVVVKRTACAGMT